ncbi:MAG: glycosyltransferase [Verrucomicrobia bacterium]|nr:glycosyltransferase [Verrucomicrobiota bacterium]MBI3867898.1 glycosyltransferase [Verrucomicrobiota bacterium]
MDSTAPSLLILIPAYNEEQRIEPVLRDYGRYFRDHYPGRCEIVVVLNGCVDGTFAVVQKVALELPLISALDFPSAIGKGGALIEGMRLAPQYDLVGYVDADGATAPEDFHELIRRIDGVDCVVASRWIEGAVLNQAQASHRQFASRVFHVIVELLFWMGIKDTQCGAKVMRSEAIALIHENLRISDMAFDINLLYAMKRAEFRIREHPTVWTDKLGSKVVLGKTSLTMLLSVIRVRLIYSPFYPLLRLFRPVETWLYLRLRAPLPRQRMGRPNRTTSTMRKSDVAG